MLQYFYMLYIIAIFIKNTNVYYYLCIKQMYL
jgi:hypothetical protein